MLVDDPPGAEPQARHLPLPILQRLPARAERARADRARGRHVAAAARAHAVRRRRAEGWQAAVARRVAQDAATAAEPVAAATAALIPERGLQARSLLQNLWW